MSCRNHWPVLFVLACLAMAVRAEPPVPVVAGPKWVDPSTLKGKLMCGYQGWFNAGGDGAGRGWVHWGRGSGAPAPGRVTVDLWPDLTGFGDDEKFTTRFRHADGRPAEMFSSFSKPTVLRHFQWMREYGIDGIFLQRFVVALRDEAGRRHNNTVLSHCREGAKQFGRTYAVMYDLSGLAPGNPQRLIDDWKTIHREINPTSDVRYQRHEGRPVVALWGCGFGDDKKRPNLADWRRIVTFFKNDAVPGGCAVMLGVPSYWREFGRDAVSDPELHEVLKMADILSPWTVGRYRTPEQVEGHGRKVWQPDREWCAARGLDFLPVAYPGFSWHNMTGQKLGAIPRLGGRFFWSQVLAAKSAGADMLYVAMFDEVDEGTAIFKCTNDPPVGEGVSFLDYKGLPSDHYLRLAGHAARMMRGEPVGGEELPK